MEELIALLAAIRPMSPQLENHLRKIIRWETAPGKKVLLKAGDVCTRICFIKKGLIRCYYMKDEEEVNSWFMREGDLIVSIPSFYHQVPSYEYIQTMENCEFFYITKQELDHMYEHYMEFNYIGRVLHIKYYIELDRLVYAIRMRSSIERLKHMYENNSDLLSRVPAKHLASYLGITRSTFHRMKKAIMNRARNGKGDKNKIDDKRKDDVKKIEMKKIEMKKIEMKKDEMKKDEMKKDDVKTGNVKADNVKTDIDNAQSASETRVENANGTRENQEVQKVSTENGNIKGKRTLNGKRALTTKKALVGKKKAPVKEKKKL